MQPRLIVLLGAVAAAALLPLAGAAAGPVGDRDAKSPLPSPAGAPAGTPAEGPADASRCGPELSSPDGVEAQTCVLTQDLETWARTYYRNVTGEELAAVLTMMGPGARTVRMHCAVGAGDEPGVCETPRERSAGETAAYSAVAEFAAGESGALLLRSGSNSGAPSGS
ncbi:Secreted protein OS=Streptomyces alboniger OX=132473 GN=CP975_17250 PE=4 SV=1 [Streptomyces alboniger]